jgi:surface carbohydrate biosynthesis protein
MKKKYIKKICIIVDHPSRELDYVCLVSFKLLEQENYNIFIVEYYKKELVLLINPDLIIFPHARENMVQLIKNCKNNNILIAILETEGGFIGKLFTGINKYIKKALKLSDLYFVWGKKNYSNIKKINLKKNFFLTGTPKFDFFRDELKDYYKSKNKYVTFVSNFAIVNPKFTSPEKNIIEYQKSEFASDKKKIDLIFACQKSIFDKFINLIQKTVPKLSKEQFILKIHPFENDLPYKKKLKFKNLKFIQDENIAETMSKTRVLIHYNCQTSFEFFLKKKYPIAYSFLLSRLEKKYGNNELIKHSIKPRNFNEYIKSINKKYKFKDNDTFVNKYGYRNKKFLSSEMIAQKIIFKLSNHRKKQNLIPNYYLLIYALRILLKDLVINLFPKPLIIKLKIMLNKKNINDKKLNINLVKKNLSKIKKIFKSKKHLSISHPFFYSIIKNQAVIKISK